MSNWIYLKAVEDLAVCLLLFALLTACVARWRRRKLAITISAAYAMVFLGIGLTVLAFGLRLQGEGLDYSAFWGGVVIPSMALHTLGFAVIARKGWRRVGESGGTAAASWPRLRLLGVVAIAVLLSLVTEWNLRLAVRQRLARAQLEARILAQSVTPSRPIDPLNAALIYEPVFDQLKKADKDAVPVEWTDFDKPLDADDPKVRDLLSRHEHGLTMLHRAAARSHCYFERHGIAGAIATDGPEGPPYWGSLGPLHVAAHMASRLMAVDTRVKLADGDVAGAARNTATLFRMAHHAGQDPGLVSMLVSKTIDQWGGKCLQALLNHPNLSKDVLGTLQLTANVDYRTEFRRTLVMDEVMSIVAVNQASANGIWPLVEDERYYEWDDPNDHLWGLFMWSIGHVYIIEEELERLRAIHHEWKAILQLPWPTASARFDEMREGYHKYGVLPAIILPPIHMVLDRSVIGDARHRLARLAIAMRRYEFEHGKLPDSFDSLTPNHIDDVPLDPSTEEPFKLENVEGGVRLYSGGIEAWYESPGERTKGKVEMFLKSRKQADN